MKLDYWGIIKKSWEVAWRYKILWIFGFFVGASGGNFNFGGSSSGNGEEVKLPSQAWQQIEQFLKHNLLLMVIIAALVVVVFLFFLIARWLAKPALIKLAADAEEVRPSFLRGLSIGRQFLWRYIAVGWLIWLPYIIFVVVPLGILIIFFAIDVLRSQSASLLFPSLLAILVGILAAFILAVPVLVLTQFSHRYLVLENVGVRQAISGGWRLVKSKLKNAAVLWLISWGLSIGVSLALFFLLLIVLIPGAAIGFGLMMAAQSKNLVLLVLFAILASIAVIIFIVLFFLAQGLIGAFLTNYWTFAYLKLTEGESSAV